MQKYAHLVELEKCCRTHIFLQNFVLRRPRTSPPENLQKLVEKRQSTSRCISQRRRASSSGSIRSTVRRFARSPVSSSNLSARGRRCLGRRQRAPVGKISAKCCSFSAVSAPIFARKYAFCSIFQNLPDSQAEIFEIWQNFANFATFAIFFFSGAGGWRSAPKRPRLPGRKGNTEKEGDKRPRRSAAPSSGCGSVLLKFAQFDKISRVLNFCRI